MASAKETAERLLADVNLPSLIIRDQNVKIIELKKQIDELIKENNSKA